MLRSGTVMAALNDEQSRALADQCVQCGLCLPHCPTYAAAPVETESPRGRIVLIKALSTEPSRSLIEAAQASLDHCLGCRQCESVCPAGVPFDSLLVAGRSKIAPYARRPFRANLLLWLVKRPLWLAAAMRLARTVRQRIAGAVIGPTLQPGWHRCHGERRGRVALLTGCIAHWLDVSAHAAAIRCLNRRGWDVWVPEQSRCCGSLHDHAGQPAVGESLRLTLSRSVASGIALDAAVSCSTGCVEAHSRALHPLPVYDVMSFLDQNCSPPAPGAVTDQTASALMHAPCTLRNGLKRPNAGRAALAQAGCTSLGECPSICCGAGGWNSWLDASRSAMLFAPLGEWLKNQPRGEIMSHNIACRMHIQGHLGSNRKILHPVEVLDRLDCGEDATHD